MYHGSKINVVSVTIIIMNIWSVFRVSNTFTNELFCFLSGDLLPTSNKLLRNHYAARKSIRRLGLHYNNIHVCPNGCILYHNEHAPFDRCPKCTQSRWVDGTNDLPTKVIRHFPLIPKLKWMWCQGCLSRCYDGVMSWQTPPPRHNRVHVGSN